MAESDDDTTFISGVPVVCDWDWWNDFLQREYYGSSAEAESWREIARSIVRECALPAGSRVVDLGSGCGELALNLAGLGMEVTAVEASSRLVERCTRLASERNESVQFVQADMFAWEPADGLDLVLSINTSFGYGTNEQNRELIGRIATWLLPGGVFYLDVVSADNAVSFGTWNDELCGGRLIVENSWESDEQLMISFPTWISPQGEIFVAETPETVRIYTRSEVESLFTATGFVWDRLRRPMGRNGIQNEESLGTTWLARRR